MAGLRPIFVTTILIGLFTVCLLIFANEFITKNNQSSGLLTDPTVANASQSLQSTLNGAQGITQGIADVVRQDQGSPVQIFLILTSMLKIPWQFFDLMIGLVKTSFLFVFSSVFGSSFQLVINVIFAIIIGTVIFLIVKLIRTGESER